MDKKHFLWISGITLAALILAVLLPGGRTVEDNPKLPWLIEVDARGLPTVFGLTIGETTLQQARQVLQQQGEVNLFASAAGTFAVEAYFQRLYLGGIRGDMVLSLELEQQQMALMFDRGLRISQLESGGKKIRISEGDMTTVDRARLGHITYIPASDLDQELILSRFGDPVRRIPEPTGITHWLYPDKGLDIALNPEGSEVFQYLPPARFDEVLKPLTGEAPTPGSSAGD